MDPSYLLAVPRSLEGLWEQGHGEGAELPARGKGGGGHWLGNDLGWAIRDAAGDTTHLLPAPQAPIESAKCYSPA